MSAFLQAVGFGVASGAVIALGAVGLTVQVGIANSFNVGYGSLMTLAAFVAYGLDRMGLSLWWALLCAALVVAMCSVALNRVLVAPLQRRGSGFIGVIIGTVYAGLIVEYIIVSLAGPDVVTLGSYWGLTTVQLWDFTFTAIQLVIVGVAAALMLALHFALSRTTFGRALRATSGNEQLARACGIRTTLVIDGAWALTGALCGIAGGALAITVTSFDFTLGQTFLIDVLAAAVLGGVGQPYGAMLGGLIVGIVSQVAALYSTPVFQNVAAFGLLVLILVVRPHGVLSRRGSIAGMWET